MKRESYPRLMWQGTYPVRVQALVALAFVLIDTALASLGVGMVLPLFQAMFAPAESSGMLNQLFPALREMTSGERILWIGGATALLFIVKGIVSLVTVAVSRRTSQNLCIHWVESIGRRYLLGIFRAQQREKQGVLLNNWFNESIAGARCFMHYLQYVASVALAIALVALGLIVNWKAMLIFLVFSGLTVFLMRRRAFGVIAKLGERRLKLNQVINATMAESLAHVRDLKLLTAEPARLDHINAKTRDLGSVIVKSEIMNYVPKVAAETLSVVGLIGIMAGGVVMTSANPMDFLPMLAFYFVAFYRLISAGSLGISARMRFLNDVDAMRLMRSLDAQDVTLEERDGGMPVERLTEDIRFEGISFSYGPDRPVLFDIDLVIPRGKVTFLIGRSGAGKSTLLDLLMRLQRPTQGRITVGGRDISEFNLVQWRRTFGYVSQDAALFNGSIRMNLTLAKPDTTEEEIVEACRLAGIHEFIQSLPDGYDTVVGDRGHSVSGGQRKRIAIARALMLRPQVLILDEATTSFEQTLEAELIERLALAIPSLTVLQVTHRLQTAATADFVIVLENGRVMATGTWEEVRQRETGSMRGTH